MKCWQTKKIFSFCGHVIVLFLLDFFPLNVLSNRNACFMCTLFHTGSRHNIIYAYTARLRTKIRCFNDFLIQVSYKRS